MTTLHTIITNTSGDLARVRDMVSELERVHDLPKAVVFDLNVVLDEVLSNIFKFAYADKSRHEISVRLSADHTGVEVGIEDDGKAFDPSIQPEPDRRQPLAARPVGGLGLHFVRRLMDEVQYRREKDRNYLILKKKM